MNIHLRQTYNYSSNTAESEKNDSSKMKLN